MTGHLFVAASKVHGALSGPSAFQCIVPPRAPPDIGAFRSGCSGCVGALPAIVAAVFDNFAAAVAMALSRSDRF